ncbi:nucleotidyltransferase domain-containing protein [archaeon]|nr:nucleotidyltransferase domain-containing protein [Nanoarchaeota archaeon]MBU4300566.1 nucleotidyltransferase domain-containing protein [Nanoarchaeota archaeon]MBU4451479.1 nucleotidyltransferase domain-containing protein [Nanoarchaeota archaeon]MCG2724011.1 nucleotidyltransferase domain-containing protein [archaeon]
MLTKEQLKIFAVFKKDIFASLTFKQIKAQSLQKSNNIVQLALKEFQKQNLLNAQKTGDVTAYSLNLDNNMALSYLNLINELELYANKKLPKDMLKDIQNRIFKYSEFFILLVFGSYAENKATEKSDLDIALIAESEQSKKEMAPYIETIKRRALINIDYHIFTRKEFLEMLQIDQQNVGKEIYRKNIIYYGLIEYYNLIWRVKK